jgi:hypothetical protein
VDVTPGITALNAQLPALLAKYAQTAKDDEDAALAALQADIGQILSAETAAVDGILVKVLPEIQALRAEFARTNDLIEAATGHLGVPAIKAR